MDVVFQALSHPARREVIERLAQREHTVGELAEPLNMSLPAVSKHIKVLERAGLLQRRVIGRQHRCRLMAAPLHEASAWLRYYDNFWSDRLTGLNALFDSDQLGDHGTSRTPLS